MSINYSLFLDSFTSELPPFVSKQAISKARQEISHEAFIELFRLSVEQFYCNSTNLQTWNGFHIYAVDGSTEYLVTNLLPVQMPVTKFSELYRMCWGIESKYREVKKSS